MNQTNIEIPNPFVDCDTLEDASSIAGISINAPEAIDGYEQPAFRAVENDMIEVIYNAQEGEDQLRIRKAFGTGDISGDYNVYAETETVTVNGHEVTLKGNDGKAAVATWENDSFAYSITSSSALDKVFITDLVKSLDGGVLIGGDPATWGPNNQPDDDVMVGKDPATWEPVNQTSVEIPNPFVDCDALEDASGIAGISINAPEAIDGYEQPAFRAAENDMIEVIYNAQEGEDQLRIRKAFGTGDISGDYNAYAETETVIVNGHEVTLKGNDGKVAVVTWENNGFAYSITSRSALDKVFMTDLMLTLDDSVLIGEDPATWGPSNQPDSAK